MITSNALYPNNNLLRRYGCGVNILKAQSRLLILFAKNPRTEQVKTRLARDIGQENAVRVYTYLLKENIRIHSHAPYDFMVYTQGDPSYFSPLRTRPQNGSDLGEKMHGAFVQELHQYTRVVLIGSDLILSSDCIAHAFSSLEREDLVIGPATDGGYYLIGMKEDLDIFSDIPWSSSTVFIDTIQKIKGFGKSIAMLSELRDIDTGEDIPYYPEVLPLIHTP